MKAVRTEMQEYRNSVSSLVATVGVCSDKINNLTTHMEAIENTSARTASDKDGEDDPYDFSSEDEEEVQAAVAAAHAPRAPAVETPQTQAHIEPARLEQFKSALQQLFREERASSLPLARIHAHANAAQAHAPFTDTELRAALARMTHDNQVMLADDIVFLI
ncbi:DNA replication licensing factor Mcm3 [Eumeta japonica]|uniref:DNA replication licensing factor Mcm3 n=1 Tax=Eumeta variegata TaxID=151549 RepID=A0A4C1ZRV9_EUMVA|nr:DNA replication licensing factor Mcm3 [Eumeta japonica]